MKNLVESLNRSKLLIYWWDGWPPHPRYKRLFMQGKYSRACNQDPNEAPKKCGFLRTPAEDSELVCRILRNLDHWLSRLHAKVLDQDVENPFGNLLLHHPDV
jgi:hypothetical protein